MLSKIFKIKEAQSVITDLNAELELTKEALEEANKTAESNKNFAGDLQGEIAEQKIEIESLEEALEDANATVEDLKNTSLKSAEVAADIVAEVGCDEPVEVESSTKDSKEELWEEFNSLKDSTAKVEFYKANRDKLLQGINSK